jgi:acetyl esterase/lipase
MERQPAAVTSLKDIIYTKAADPHPRQKLDIYYPAELTPSSPAPIVLFVHGGAWKRGDKGWFSLF